MGLNRTIRKTLDEHSNLSVFINWMSHDTTNEVLCMLGVSVNITLTLLQIQELCSSPEFVRGGVSNVCLSRDLKVSYDPNTYGS